MPTTSHELMSIAREQGQHASEGWRRSAISRAYYAAYHRCQEWEQALPALGANMGEEGGRHQELINRLKHPDRTCSAILKLRSKANGVQLEVQRERRVKADYRLGDWVSEKELGEQLDQVAQLIARCDQPSCADSAVLRTGRITDAGTPPPSPNPSGTPPSAPR
ncbi:MAG: hypothetical protein J7598_11800 [Mitsuaria chitosanitabida]|uniref:hypothetical protein n=1 Tax=Roseateles chitosanitabidus TaxID=65048 RepID=UPI001B21A10D|nr:hypothetical protein [Roseateles chitosanitabidus]MBO9687290.1 hypothetical protein [Roseateles chitosanitabidus]